MSERGEYRSIRTVLVDGPDYQTLTPRARLTLLTLKLNLGPTGIDVLYAGQLTDQTGYDAAEVEAALRELEAGGWLKRERNVMWIVDGLKHDPAYTLTNANHLIRVREHLLALPRLAIVRAFASHYGVTLPDASPPPIPSPIPSGIPLGMASNGDTPSQGGSRKTKTRGKTEDKKDKPSAPAGAGLAGSSTEAPPRPAPRATDPPPGSTGQPALAPPTPPEAGRDTWLTPVAAEWERCMGAGTFEYGRCGKALKRLAPHHAPAVIAEHLARYLAVTEPQFVSVEKFAATFGKWGPKAPIVLIDPATGWMTPEGERLTRPYGYAS